MSKTITIPTNCNPYVVVINNHVYTYRAGESVEVPDAVAEAIEDAIELVPKPKRYLGKLAQRVDGSISELTPNDLEGIETMSNYAFAYCRGIEEVEIPNNVVNIESHVFYSCSKIGTVKMRDSIATIGVNAFGKCTQLARVYLPETPPSLENVNAFDNINKNCTFYCKTQASLDAYKAAPNWSTLAGTYSFVVEE